MSYNLLVVDDKDLPRRNLTIFFTQLGHAVCEANSGEAALELLARNNFDVVISDLRLPGGTDGMGLVLEPIRLTPTRELKAFDHTPILATAMTRISAT